MPGTVLMIRHTRKERGDRAARLLAARGCTLLSCYPADGEPLPEPDDPRFGAVVVYGGTPSANDRGAGSSIPAELAWIEGWLATGRPYLGICLGAQMLARVLGAKVDFHPEGLHEIGFSRVTPTGAANGFLQAPLEMYQWHREGFELPSGATLLATGDVFANQAFRYGEHAYGLQFHPEVTAAMMKAWLTEGMDVLAAPGAHSLERQMCDAARFNRGVERWLGGFFDRWPGPA